MASHPTHEATQRQLKGFGAIISFDVRGYASAAEAVCAAGLQLINAPRALVQEHVPQTLLRLSVGIEAVEDLWTDLDRALHNNAAGS